METRPATAPRLFVISAIFAVFLGLLIAVYAWHLMPFESSLRLVLVVLVAMWSEHYAPIIRGHAVSIALPMAVAASVLDGPFAGLIVAALSAVRLDSFSSGRSRVITAFNMGQLSIAMGLAGIAYVAAGGPVLSSKGVFVSSDFPAALAPILFAAVTLAALNLVLTSIGVAILYRVSIRGALESLLRHFLSFVFLGLVGVLIAQVVASNVFALPLFLFPLMLARQIYQRYAALKDIYVDTVRSLINALEAKDPYTRGHSERVAGLAVELAKRYGLSERDLDVLEKAALLHDVGKLALRSSLLTKPSRLSDEEFDAMRRHPDLGADMVSRIPPLRALVVPIRQHHEWYDGSGYPSGLNAGQIDRLARILAIADAYDAMTTDRAYRPALDTQAALNELWQGGGRQFDPGLVPVFVEMVLERADVGSGARCPIAAVSPSTSGEVVSA